MDSAPIPVAEPSTGVEDQVVVCHGLKCARSSLTLGGLDG
jgi:hypothetical protein